MRGVLACSAMKAAFDFVMTDVHIAEDQEMIFEGTMVLQVKSWIITSLEFGSQFQISG